MDVKRIYCMLEKLTECAEHEVNNGIESLDTEEFGKVTDMIKDLAEAEYYRTVTVAMEEYDFEDEEDIMDYGRRGYDSYRYKRSGRFAPKGRGTYMPVRGYEEPMRRAMTPEMYREHEYEPEWYRDMDRTEHGKMYYSGSGSHTSTMGSDSTRSYGGQNESKYDRAKRNYTETKQMHKGNTVEDKQANMKSLEGMLKEFGDDVMDIVGEMTQDEKNLAKQKLSMLVTKLN